MQPIRKVLLRRHLKRELREGNLSPAREADVRDVLANPHALNALLARVAAHGEEKKLKAIGDGKLLQWLWDHRAEILAFIQEIMKLFA